MKSKFFVNLIKDLQARCYSEPEVHALIQFDNYMQLKEALYEFNSEPDFQVKFRDCCVQYKNLTVKFFVINKNSDYMQFYCLQFGIICFRDDLDLELKNRCRARLRREPFIELSYRVD